ncbi:unnamed protein product, partial [Staurois parvus]
MLVILTVEPKVNPLHCLKMLLDPDFSAPLLLPVPPSYLLIRHIMWRVTLHMLSLVCMARVFFFLWEGA